MTLGNRTSEQADLRSMSRLLPDVVSGVVARSWPLSRAS